MNLARVLRARTRQLLVCLRIRWYRFDEAWHS